MRIDINEGIRVCSPFCSQIAEAGNMGEELKRRAEGVDK